MEIIGADQIIEIVGLAGNAQFLAELLVARRVQEARDVGCRRVTIRLLIEIDRAISGNRSDVEQRRNFQIGRVG